MKTQTYCSTKCQAGKHPHLPTSHICGSVWLGWLGPTCWSNLTSAAVPYILSIHRPKCVLGFCKFVPRRRGRLTSKCSHFVVICKPPTRARFLKPKLSKRERCGQCLHSQLTTDVYQHLASLVRQFCFANIALRGHSLERWNFCLVRTSIRERLTFFGFGKRTKNMKEWTHERIYYWANSAPLEITDKLASAA